EECCQHARDDPRAGRRHDRGDNRRERLPGGTRSRERDEPGEHRRRWRAWRLRRRPRRDGHCLDHRWRGPWAWGRYGWGLRAVRRKPWRWWGRWLRGGRE